MNDILKLAYGVCPFTICGEGNVSGRFEDKFYIKASGSNLKTLTYKDLTLCDMDGNKVVDSDKKQSIETLFHAWIYRNFPEINYIAHTHPINTVKILCSDELTYFSQRRLYPDQIVRNGSKSCVVPYGCPGKELLDLIEKCVNKFLDKEGYFPKLILLQNHGIISAASNVEDCIHSTHTCEKSAEIFIGASLLGGIHFLTSNQVEQIDNCPEEIYRKNLDI